MECRVYTGAHMCLAGVVWVVDDMARGGCGDLLLVGWGYFMAIDGVE